MIFDLVTSLGAWNWIILGLVLLGIEVLAPGTFILWLGLAALATGLVTFAVDMTWQAQLILYAVLSVLAVIGWWFYSGRSRPSAAEPVLHRRAEMHVGRTFKLEEPIVSGSGRVRIDDSVWRVVGPDLPAGASVRVAGTDGALLHVVEA